MAFLTIEELNTLTTTASGGNFLTYEAFATFVANNKAAIEALSSIRSRIVVRENSFLETNIDKIVEDNSDYDTIDAFVAGTVGLQRDEIRNVLASSINQQTDELLNQATMSSITLREIFLDLIQNKSGDAIRFDTVPLDDPVEDNRGKYFIESD